MGRDEITGLLKVVPGPTQGEIGHARRLLLSQLAARPPRPGSNRGWLRPGALVAAGAAFAALTLGAAASGVGLNDTVGAALDAGVQLSGGGNRRPEGTAANNHGPKSKDAKGQVQATETSPAAPPDAGSDGRGVSEAVHDAIDSSGPGPGRGQAVKEAACNAAKDRSTLPEPAQSHGPPDDNPSQACPDGENGEPAGDGQTITPTPTPTPGGPARPQSDSRPEQGPRR